MAVEGLQDAVKLLEGIVDFADGDVLDDIALREIIGREPPGEVWAVDGGSRVLFDLPGVVIGAYRASWAVWRPSGMEEKAGNIIVDSITKGDQKELLGLLGYGEDRESWEAAALAVGLHRKKLEWELVLEAVESASEDAVVLVDGSLDPILEPVREISRNAIKAASRRGVDLVGISKKSDLAVKGLPCVPILQWKATNDGVTTGWFAKMENVCEDLETFIVRFTGFSDHVFRVDTAGGGMETVSRLVGLCNDAGYPGYPFPLARAHNISVIDGGTCDDLRSQLEGGLGGRPALFWKYLSSNFHNVLDGGVL